MKLLPLLAAVLPALALAAPENINLIPRDEHYSVILTQIENDFVPMGRLVGQELYDKVYAAMDKLCPKGGYDNACITDKVVKFPNIEWDDHANFKDNGNIYAYVSGNWFPKGHEDVRGALMHQVAAAFMLSTQDNKNCYHDDLKGRGNVFHCNAPRGVCVYNTQPDLKDTSMLCLNLRPDFIPVRGGEFDCVAILGSVGDFLRNNKDGVQDEFKKALGNDKIWSQERCTDTAIKHITGRELRRSVEDHPTIARSTAEALSLRNGNWVSGKVTATAQDPVLRVRISTGDKVHVGQYKGQQLYDAIHNGLHEKCEKEFGQNTCKPNDAASISNVEYSFEGSVKTDASVYIQGYKNNFPEGKKGLRDAFIHQAAGTFGVSSEDEKNCFTKNIDGKSYHWCNLPHEVTIWLDTGAKDGSDAFLTVHLGFSKSKSVGGCFDCKAIVGATNAFAFFQGPDEEFKRALGKDKLDVVVDCFTWDVKCSKNLDTRDQSSSLSPWKPGNSTQLALVNGQWVNGDLTSTQTLGATEDDEYHPILRVQIHHNDDNTGTKVNVGQYSNKNGNNRGDLLFTKIKDGLYKQCPEGVGGRETCNPGAEVAILTDVRYGKDGASIKRDGTLYVGVKNSYFPEDKPGLREAFIHLAAATFKAATDDEKNCWEGKHGETKSYWCNIPRQINIWVWDRNVPGVDWAHIDVFARFNKPNPGGCYDCKAALDQVHYYATEDGPKDEFAKALGRDVDHLPLVIDCADWNVQC